MQPMGCTRSICGLHTLNLTELYATHGLHKKHLWAVHNLRTSQNCMQPMSCTKNGLYIIYEPHRTVCNPRAAQEASVGCT
ncbi:hypothetical protein CEXT_415121 [Caerostris extrusa]|uniref:Uncharacterized protein n=1 Tax=Caerostris extrusa TaxID=172846 RepID=A0AAV4NSD7_CAEEX|nr:hypothetical protein CEXT_415121 [Caerostris extrusa]